MQGTGQDAGLTACLQNNCACAIAKQDACGAILKIQDAGKHFCTNHQYLAIATGSNHGIGNRHGIHKSSTYGLHIKSGATVMGTQLVLNHAGGTRKAPQMVWCGGGQNNQIKIRSSAIGACHCSLRCFHAKVAGQLVITCKVACLNTAARLNPLVTGI